MIPHTQGGWMPAHEPSASWRSRIQRSATATARRRSAFGRAGGRVFPAIAPMALSKQGTYGALGIAAALLLGLFLISRLMVGAAVVNATLWERKTWPVFSNSWRSSTKL